MCRFRWFPLLCLLLGACADRKQSAEETLREVGPEALRKDAALLYKERFGSSGGEFSVIAESDWPRSFRRFRPQRVGAYPDGFSLAVETDADTECGLFVLPQHFEVRTPRGAGAARFEPLAEGIYWYEFAR